MLIIHFWMATVHDCLHLFGFYLFIADYPDPLPPGLSPPPGPPLRPPPSKLSWKRNSINDNVRSKKIDNNPSRIHLQVESLNRELANIDCQEILSFSFLSLFVWLICLFFDPWIFPVCWLHWFCPALLLDPGSSPSLSSFASPPAPPPSPPPLLSTSPSEISFLLNKQTLFSFIACISSMLAG